MTDQELRFEMDLYWNNSIGIHPLLVHIKQVHGTLITRDTEYRHYMPKYNPAKQTTTVHLDEVGKPHKGKTTLIKEGKMITRMFPKLAKAEVTHLMEWWHGYKMSNAVRITQNDSEMEEVVGTLVESEDGAQSCMTRGGWIKDLYEKTKLHPYMCYKHSLGWSLAYIKNAEGVITDRAIVNRHSMKYVRAYTTSTGIAVGHTFQHALELLGYRHTEDWDGHKIHLLTEPESFTNANSLIKHPARLIVPFVDGNSSLISAETGEMLSGISIQGSYVTAKASYGSVFVPIRCTGCGNYIHNSADVSGIPDEYMCGVCCNEKGYVRYLASDGVRRHSYPSALVRVQGFYIGGYFNYTEKCNVVYSKHLVSYLDTRDAVWSYIHGSYVSKQSALYDQRYGYYCYYGY